MVSVVKREDTPTLLFVCCYGDMSCCVMRHLRNNSLSSFLKICGFFPPLLSFLFKRCTCSPASRWRGSCSHFAGCSPRCRSHCWIFHCQKRSVPLSAVNPSPPPTHIHSPDTLRGKVIQAKNNLEKQNKNQQPVSPFKSLLKQREQIVMMLTLKPGRTTEGYIQYSTAPSI